MKYELTFFKQDNKWYADVPGHTLEDNEMVFGSDTLLDTLASGQDTLVIEFTTERPIDGYYMHLCRTEHDFDGAYYLITDTMDGNVEDLNQTIWICNVTHDVCGEHPEEIFVLQFYPKKK